MLAWVVNATLLLQKYLLKAFNEQVLMKEQPRT